MRRSQAARRHQQGFTLIELVISTAITGIVMAAIGGMISTMLVNMSAQRGRLDQTHDVQSLAAYLNDDIRNAGVRDWTDNARPTTRSLEVNVGPTTGLYPCGAGGTPNAVLRIAWNDFDPTVSPMTTRLVVASYVASPTGPSGTLQLHRLVCRKDDISQPGSPTVRSDTVVVSALATAPAAPSCDTSCTAATPPTEVSLTVVVKDPQTTGSDRSVTLTAHVRQT